MASSFSSSSSSSAGTNSCNAKKNHRVQLAFRNHHKGRLRPKPRVMLPSTWMAAIAVTMKPTGKSKWIEKDANHLERLTNRLTHHFRVYLPWKLSISGPKPESAIYRGHSIFPNQKLFLLWWFPLKLPHLELPKRETVRNPDVTQGVLSETVHTLRFHIPKLRSTETMFRSSLESTVPA